MKMQLRREPLPGRLAFSGLLLLLFWLPLPWGSHRPWAEHLLEFGAGLLLMAMALGRLLHRPPAAALPLRYRWAALLWLLWLLWIGLQLLPLPVAWLQSLSPAALAVHAGVPVGPIDSLSVAPAASAESWLLSLGYFSLYLVAAVLCRDRARRRLVAGTLVLAGLIQAVYGSLMTLSGAEIGFVVRKTYYLGFATGTFVNRNHLAAYLELAGAAGVGLVVADLKAGGPGDWRMRLSNWIGLIFSTKARIRIALSMIVIGLVMSRSRMGNTAFFVALSVSGLGYLLLRERRLFLPALALFSSLLLIDTLIVSRWFGLEKVVQRIENTQLEQEQRLEVYLLLPPMVQAYSNTGSGLGSFGVAFTPYKPADLVGYLDHAHNDYLEFLIEAGIPGVIVLALLLAFHVLHAINVVLRRNDRLAQGICLGYLMATLALAVHAVVEFNFQIPAIAASYAVLMGLAASCSASGRSKGGKDGQKAVAAAPPPAAEAPEFG
jgi:O-antigen ligase